MNITNTLDHQDLKLISNAIRVLSIDAIEKAKSGHPGLPLGMSDVVSVLFSKFLKFNPKDPNWIDRDRFILSAGHGSMLLYSILHLTGYSDYNLDTLKQFRQKNSKAAGHPENIYSDAVETSSGPLGQGFANAVGMAMAEKILSSKFGEDIINHYTYTIVGDGCLMEGISYEAASLAGHFKLNKLVVLFDNNSVSIDGSVELTNSENIIERFVACGWYVEEIDGHDYDEINEALQNAKNSNLPSFISCKTTIGKYLGKSEGTAESHSWPIDKEDIIKLKQNINWQHEPFIIPSNIYECFDETKQKNYHLYKIWNDKFNALNYITKDKLIFDITRQINTEVFGQLNQMRKKHDIEVNSTRKYSGDIISKLLPTIDNLLGGSADLSSSNNTYVQGMVALQYDTDNANYIHYGVREHAMSACMNGVLLHGGFVPYVGTFFIFSDYCRPAIRMSALMKLPAIYIMTHDSIGVGEDGPTHQPVEHLSSFRAMPNINIYRPANMLETIDCWDTILKTKDKPSILVLSRQKVKEISEKYNEKNKYKNNVSRGAYIISDYDNNNNKELQFTLFSSGTEISIALEVQKKLSNNNINSCVVSVPCMEIFEEQSLDYQKSILDNNSIKVSIEAGNSMSWNRYIGIDGIHVGIEDFGISAPAQDVYDHFKLNAEFVYQKCINKINK